MSHETEKSSSQEGEEFTPQEHDDLSKWAEQFRGDTESAHQDDANAAGAERSQQARADEARLKLVEASMIDPQSPENVSAAIDGEWAERSASIDHEMTYRGDDTPEALQAQLAAEADMGKKLYAEHALAYMDKAFAEGQPDAMLDINPSTVDVHSPIAAQGIAEIFARLGLPDPEEELARQEKIRFAKSRGHGPYRPTHVTHEITYKGRPIEITAVRQSYFTDSKDHPIGHYNLLRAGKYPSGPSEK